jgi:hypothetical protein
LAGVERDRRSLQDATGSQYGFADGQRFLIVTNGTLQSALPITVVLNWRQPNTR